MLSAFPPQAEAARVVQRPRQSVGLVSTGQSNPGWVEDLKIIHVRPPADHSLG